MTKGSSNEGQSDAESINLLQKERDITNELAFPQVAKPQKWWCIFSQNASTADRYQVHTNRTEQKILKFIDINPKTRLEKTMQLSCQIKKNNANWEVQSNTNKV